MRWLLAGAGLLTFAGCPPRSEKVDAGPALADSGDSPPSDAGSDGGAGGGTDGGGADAGGADDCAAGSELFSETADAGHARYGSVFSDRLYVVTDLPAPPPGWMDEVNPSVLSVRVLRSGQPVPDCLVRWQAAPSHGWVFPFTARTDAAGRARAIWTAGSVGEQRLEARISVAGEGIQAVAMSGLAQPHVTRSNSIHLSYLVPEPWQRFQVEVTPITFPATTYYSAIGFAGGYFGIQNRGSTAAPALVDKWLLFSVWDEPAGDAQLVDAGPMTCQGFAGEGTGRQCYLAYDWQVGGTYRFEVTYDQPPGSGHTDYSASITDVGTGVTLQLATLRHQAEDTDRSVYGFVEDWAETASSCLATSERAAYFHQIRYQSAGTWKEVRGVRFSRVYNEWHNEICANYAFGVEAGKFLWSSGGDQRVSRPLLRTESVLPVVSLP